MSHITEANFEQPQVYKPLPAEMFRSAELLNTLNRDFWSPVVWEKGKAPDSKMEEALQPMIDAVQEAVPDVEGMNIDIYTSTIKPGKAQIEAANRWHWDGHVQYMMASSDSNLTTKVLYIPKSLSPAIQQEARETIEAAEQGKWNLENNLIENGIKMGMFAVAQAAQYGMIDMNGMVHQSPSNPTNKTIARTFLRAEIIRSHSLVSSQH